MKTGEDIVKNIEFTAAVIGATVALITVWKKLIYPFFKKMKEGYSRASVIIALSEQGGEMIDSLKEVVATLNKIEKSTSSIEREVYNSSERFKSLLNFLDIGFWEADEFGQFTYVNKKILEICGRSPERMFGNNWVSAIAEEDRERVKHEWDDAVRQHREMNVEFSFLNDDGTKTRVRAHSHPIKSKYGEIVNFIGRCVPA